MSNYVSISALADMGFKGDRIPGVGCSPNVHKTFEGFHISYRGDDGGYGGPTTAIVLSGRVFFVLNGAHCKELNELACTDGIDGCIGYFIANLGQANKHSEHRMATRVAFDRFNLYETTLQVIGQENLSSLTKAIEIQSN